MAASKEFPSGSLSRHIKFFALSVSILILAFGFDISGLSIFFFLCFLCSEFRRIYRFSLPNFMIQYNIHLCNLANAG